MKKIIVFIGLLSLYLLSLVTAQEGITCSEQYNLELNNCILTKGFSNCYDVSDWPCTHTRLEYCYDNKIPMLDCENLYQKNQKECLQTLESVFPNRPENSEDCRFDYNYLFIERCEVENFKNCENTLLNIKSDTSIDTFEIRWRLSHAYRIDVEIPVETTKAQEQKYVPEFNTFGFCMIIIFAGLFFAGLRKR